MFSDRAPLWPLNAQRTTSAKQHKSSPAAKQAGHHRETTDSTPPTNNPTKNTSPNASGHSFVSQQRPHKATPPLYTQQLHTSRTKMKITCSAWSSSFFVLHTMRGTHDKVTCSRHTRKEQPFGLQPGTREAKMQGTNIISDTHLFSSLIPKSNQIPPSVLLLPSRGLLF